MSTRDWALVLYIALTVFEFFGLVLVAAEWRDARAMWLSHAEGSVADREAVQQDLRWQMDQLMTRYGISPLELRRALNAVDSLMGARPRQGFAALSILGGLVTGFFGNFLALGF